MLSVTRRNMRGTYVGKQLTTCPPHARAVDLGLIGAAPGPCLQCESYGKELIAKDRLIEELRGKLDTIHTMSASKRTLEEAIMEKTDSDSDDCIRPIKNLNNEESAPAVRLKDFKSLGGEEVRFTVQQIIDKVIDGSPKRKYIFETRSDCYNNFLRRFELELESVGIEDNIPNGNGTNVMPKDNLENVSMPKEGRVKPLKPKKKKSSIPITRNKSFPSISISAVKKEKTSWNNSVTVSPTNIEEVLTVSHHHTPWNHSSKSCAQPEQKKRRVSTNWLHDSPYSKSVSKMSSIIKSFSDEDILKHLPEGTIGIPCTIKSKSA
ncbi:unnamed protein product [Orchesella dallaii]|uniref:Uncharacterized protein n=1 Tax=Orchesella dallaii TaxID=48710 RepID=A0ABP1S5I5_9HEXA